MHEISRRRITSGVAWTVPVIMVGQFVPVAAASPPVVIVQAENGGCKFPGQSVDGYPFGYKILLNVTGVPAGTLVTFVSASVPSGATPVLFKTQNLTVDANGQVEVIIGSTNSANGTCTLTFSVAGYSTTATVAFGAGFNPCKK